MGVRERLQYRLWLLCRLRRAPSLPKRRAIWKERERWVFSPIYESDPVYIRAVVPCIFPSEESERTLRASPWMQRAATRIADTCARASLSPFPRFFPVRCANASRESWWNSESWKSIPRGPVTGVNASSKRRSHVARRGHCRAFLLLAKYTASGLC